MGQEYDTINKIHLFKLSSSGDTLWNKVIGESQKSYTGESIIYNKASGKLFLSGMVSDTSDPTPSSIDWFLAELDVSGNIIWSKRYGGVNMDYAAELKQTADKGFVLVGYTYSFGNYDGDIYLVKTDSLGNFQWQQTYGGVGFDISYSITFTNDGGYMICGGTKSYSPDSDLLVIKTDSLGNTEWQQTYGTAYNDDLGRITKLRDGNFLISYSSGDSTGNTAEYLKIDSAGNVIWQKLFHSGANSSFLNAAIENPDSSIVNIAGVLDANGQYFSWLIKTTNLGDTLWTKKYRASITDDLLMRDIQATPDGGYIFCGMIYTHGINVYKAWVVKVDSLGCDNSSCLTSTDLNEQGVIQKNELEIYPNPAELILNINVSNSDMLEINSTIFNCLGQEMIKQKSNSNHIQMNISNLPNGIYLITSIQGNKILSKKFIKK